MDFSMLLMPGIFVGIAFLITKNNAKYLLSGYNTMSPSERENVDIDGYLRLFKRFHLFLGISLLAVVSTMRIVASSYTDAFMVIYPISAYSWFAIKSISYFKPTRFQLRFSQGMSIFLAILALGILYMSVISFNDSSIKIEGDQLELTGIYGIKVQRKDLKNISIVSELPPITSKANGFNGGPYRKGSFRIKGFGRVKLFVNQNTKSFLFLKTTTGDIYFSAEKVNLQDEYQRIRAWANMD